jgi:tetratricopeptide (TPR) repeat protein
VGARLPALALCWLGALACATAPPLAPRQLSGWHATDAGSFRMLGDLPPAELHAFAQELALFDALFARLTQWPAAAQAPPITLYLLRDADLRRRFWLDGSMVGWALPTLEGCYATVEVRANRIQTRLTLFHEYTHALLRRGRRAGLPPWYDEGLATYFGSVGMRDGAAVVGAAPASRLAWLEARGPFALDRLLASDVRDLRGEDFGDFYATAWAFSHYLLSSPRGRRELSAFAARLESGAGWREAQAAAFARPTAALEKELAAHVALLSRGVASEVIFDAAELRPRAPGAPAPLAAGAVGYELGYLALLLRDAGAGRASSALARRLLDVALAADPSAARAEAALAESEALDGDLDEAAERLARALARAPGDARIQRHAGSVELARAEAEAVGSAGRELALRAAEEAYRRALALDARSAAAWSGLGHTLQRAERGDEAIAAFEKARSFGWSGKLDLGLGVLYLERGDRERARGLLWPLAQDPHGGETSEEAAEILERAGLRAAETAAGSQGRQPTREERR